MEYPPLDYFYDSPSYSNLKVQVWSTRRWKLLHEIPSNFWSSNFSPFLIPLVLLSWKKLHEGEVNSAINFRENNTTDDVIIIFSLLGTLVNFKRKKARVNVKGWEIFLFHRNSSSCYWISFINFSINDDNTEKYIALKSL